MSLDFTDDQSTFVQVMTWCHQATSHYLSQCWPRSLSPYGVTRPQWANDSPAGTVSWSAFSYDPSTSFPDGLPPDAACPTPERSPRNPPWVYANVNVGGWRRLKPNRNIWNPPQYSVSPIYRGRVYRGIGYITVACWTPFFCPPISRILQTWCPRAQYFREIAVTPCIQFAGDNFSRNLLTAIAFVPVRWRQFFAKSTRAYLSMRAGTHAVRWASTLGGALTPPLCHRVGSS